jgi:hypothetical protein
MRLMNPGASTATPMRNAVVSRPTHWSFGK